MNQDPIKVVITTNDQFIDGELVIPDSMNIQNSTPDNILFYFLNGGLQFITLKNCEIKDRKNIAFRPDISPVLHVRVNAIVTAQVVKDFEDTDAARLKRYNAKLSDEIPEMTDISLDFIEIDPKRSPRVKKRTKKI